MAEWRGFVERFQAQTKFDDPGQERARSGGLNWMRVQLPGPAPITLWRSAADGEIGGFVRFKGSEGFGLYSSLEEQRADIDQELSDAGLPTPEWTRDGDTAALTLRWSSPAPWTEAEQQRQQELMARAANGLVNVLRPRLPAPV